MDQLKLDVLVTRGNHVESRHRVHAAIVDAQQGLIAEARRSDEVVPWRSCAKPFQLMPLIAAEKANALYVATDQGVFVSHTGGWAWRRLGRGMPLVPVDDIEYDRGNHRLVAATFGRGLYEIRVP